MPLINVDKEAKAIQFSISPKHTAVDLLTGQTVDVNAIRLEPMLPRLLQLKGGVK